MKLFIGCSSSNEISSKYIEDCKEFLEVLFKRDNDLVFGACNKGLMGLAYNIALENKRNIIGIYPEIYEDDAKRLFCKKISTKKVNDRTSELIKNSDVLIFLPGGIGTIYELLMAIECKRGSEFDKPIIIYNSCGYFDKMLEFLNLMSDEKLVSKSVIDCFCVCDNVEDVLDYIDNYLFLSK